MQIPVLIEPVAENGFRARVGEPLPLSAEGPTPEEAIRRLRAAIAEQLQNGKQLVSLELPAADNPWLAMAGIHDANDPLVQEWKEAMAAYRQEVEDDPDRL
jgi:predicted RNase H-like HicB family nuclease